MDNNGYVYETPPEATDYTAADYSEASAEKAERKTKAEPKTHIFSLPARIGMWIVGIIAGITIIFGCLLVWLHGLEFLGVITRVETPSSDMGSGNTYNFFVYGDEGIPEMPNLPSNGEDEGSSEIPDDFDDYFEHFFGNGGGSGDNSSSAEPQAGSPGLGITVMALELEFAIDGTYTAGLVIDTIEEYSSFVGTDVRENDMIVAAEGVPTTTVEQLKSHFANKAVGDELTLTVARYSNGVASTFDVTVKLIAMQ